MSKTYQLVRYPVQCSNDAERFEQDLGKASKDGYNIEACGMSADCGQAWAIMSKPANEPPKKPDLLEAARVVATACKEAEDCQGCPLNRANGCLASGGRGKSIPASWDILKGA